MGRELRGYQRVWVDEILACPARRVLAVGPTGCGKTVVAVEVVRHHLALGRRVLLLAHRREIVLQIRDRLLSGGVAEEHVGLVLPGFRPVSEAQVQVASLASYRARGTSLHVDVVIVDEAHHSAAAVYQEVLERHADAILLGLTATPWRLDGRPLGDIFDAIVPAAPVSALVRDSYLADPRVFTVPLELRPDTSGVRRDRKGDYARRELSERVRRPVLVGSVVEHWRKLAGNVRTVCYAVDLSHARILAEQFRSIGVSAEVLSGGMANNERDRLLTLVREGTIRILINCEVLTEGWDCPSVRCCILARPTQSLSLYLQMVGRVLRPGESRPLVLDHAGLVLQHGFPTQDRSFSLDERAAEGMGGGARREKLCLVCGCALCASTRVCSFCGFEFWALGSPEETAGELAEHSAATGGHVRRLSSGRWAAYGPRSNAGQTAAYLGTYDGEEEAKHAVEQHVLGKHEATERKHARRGTGSVKRTRHGKYEAYAPRTAGKRYLGTYATEEEAREEIARATS